MSVLEGYNVTVWRGIPTTFMSTLGVIHGSEGTLHLSRGEPLLVYLKTFALIFINGFTDM